jgi:uncharacterized protein with beta-barrel porin domain
VRTRRTVAIAGATDNLEANFRAPVFAGRLEAAYRVAGAPLGLRPYAALQVQNVDLPAYLEITVFGAGAAVQAFAAQSTTDTRSELGAWIEQAIGANAMSRPSSDPSTCHGTPGETSGRGIIHAARRRWSVSF